MGLLVVSMFGGMAGHHAKQGGKKWEGYNGSAVTVIVGIWLSASKVIIVDHVEDIIDLFAFKCCAGYQITY